MGRSLARCLFQKGGEFRPTKGKGIGPGPFAKVEKTSSVAQCLFLLLVETRVSFKETASGNTRCLIFKRHRAWPDVYS